jgi:hypothetical protein
VASRWGGRPAIVKGVWVFGFFTLFSFFFFKKKKMKENKK